MTWRDIAGLFEKMELELIKSLKRNLGDHKAWEKEEGFDWPAWQAEKLKHIKRYREQNEEIMKEYHDQISDETEKMLQEQYEEGYKDESEFFDLVEKTEDGSWRLKEADGVPGEELSAEDVKKTPTEDSFFGINDNRLDKLIEDMQTVETKVESAALRMMDDVYRQTLYRAEVAMAAGATTLPQALDMATKDFLNAGINCIEYKDGRRVNIDDYAQMALRTAATKAYMQGEARKRDEMGVDTILISQYGACSETCLPWQGRVYIDDIWGSTWKASQTQYTESERITKSREFAVESKMIESREYINKFDSMTDNPSTRREYYSAAKEILSHRSGQNGEDLYLHNTRTGKWYRSTTGQEKGRPEYTDEILKGIANSEKGELVAFHNHPASMPPSFDDLNAALHNGYSSGYALCHNGRIFKYTAPNEYISESIYNIRVADFRSMGYNEFDAQVEALKYLSELYEFNFEEVD